MRLAFLFALAALALVLAPVGSSIVYIEGVTNDQLPDFDSRGDVSATEDAPTGATAATGVHVTWNTLGTPSSMIRYGGYLKTGIHAKSADAAARTWVASQSAFFRNGSADNLSLMTANRLAGSSDVHVAVYRQTFGGLPSADGILSALPWAQTDQAAAPSNYLLVDQYLAYVPVRQFFTDEIRRGRFPLWNPHLSCGMPSLAAMQASVLYPVDLLLAPIGPFHASGIAAFVKLLIAGVSTILYMRQIGASTAAGLLAAIVFSVA